MSKGWLLFASILLACAVLACIVAILAYDHSLRRPKGGVARDYDELKNIDVMVLYRDSLPKDGRNFHYYAVLYPPYANVSFEISEKGFRKWVSVQGWDVSEVDIHGEQETSSFFMEKPDGEFMTVRPENGLIYCKSVLKGNIVESSIDIAYDRSNGKAYYRYTH